MGILLYFLIIVLFCPLILAKLVLTVKRAKIVFFLKNYRLLGVITL